MAPGEGDEETSGGSPEFTLCFLLAYPGHGLCLILSESILHLSLTLFPYVSLFRVAFEEIIQQAHRHYRVDINIMVILILYKSIPTLSTPPNHIITPIQPPQSEIQNMPT